MFVPETNNNLNILIMNYEVFTNPRKINSPMSTKTTFIILLLLFSGTIFSQEIISEVIGVSGTDFSNSEGSISFTIGEPIIASYSQDDIILTQGFQQSTFTITRIDREEELEMSISVYPNPTSRFVNIVYNDEPYSCLLFDMSGKIIRREDAINGSLSIDLSSYTDGSYILNVVNGKGRQIAKYKIVKNQ